MLNEFLIRAPLGGALNINVGLGKILGPQFENAFNKTQK